MNRLVNSNTNSNLHLNTNYIMDSQVEEFLANILNPPQQSSFNFYIWTGVGHDARSTIWLNNWKNPLPPIMEHPDEAISKEERDVPNPN
jgi:hypothetical protein